MNKHRDGRHKLISFSVFWSLTALNGAEISKGFFPVSALCWEFVKLNAKQIRWDRCFPQQRQHWLAGLTGRCYLEETIKRKPEATPTEPMRLWWGEGVWDVNSKAAGKVCSPLYTLLVLFCNPKQLCCYAYIQNGNTKQSEAIEIKDEGQICFQFSCQLESVAGLWSDGTTFYLYLFFPILEHWDECIWICCICLIFNNIWIYIGVCFKFLLRYT